MHCWPLPMLPGEMPARTLAAVMGRIDALLAREQDRRREMSTRGG